MRKRNIQKQKVAKNMFFVIFSKMFISKFNITNVFLVKFPF